MASDWAGACSTIRTRFAAAWKTARGYNDAQIEQRVCWGDEHFKPQATGEYVMLTVLGGDSFESYMGEDGVGENEIVGVISVSVFTRPGEGPGLIDGLCDDVRDVFKTREDVTTVAGAVIRFDPPKAPRVGPETKGWEHKVVDISFTLEETA